MVLQACKGLSEGMVQVVSMVLLDRQVVKALLVLKVDKASRVREVPKATLATQDLVAKSELLEEWDSPEPLV